MVVVVILLTVPIVSSQDARLTFHAACKKSLCPIQDDSRYKKASKKIEHTKRIRNLIIKEFQVDHSTT